MNSSVKHLLAGIVVLLCVGAGVLVGSVAGFLVASGIPGVMRSQAPAAGGATVMITDNRWLIGGAMIGMSVGVLLGLAGGGLLGAKVINPPPPRE